MAKKEDSSLNLSYILDKQKEGKMGLSSNIVKQLSVENISVKKMKTEGPKVAAEALPANKIVSELQRLNKSLSTSLTKNLGDVAKAIHKNTVSIQALATGRNPESGKVTKRAKSDGGSLTETQLETQAYQEKQLRLLTNIEKNTRGFTGEGKKKDDKGLGGFKLGAIATGIAIALGTFLGIVRAQLKAIKFFAELLTPNALKAKIGKAMSDLGKEFQIIKDAFTRKINGVFGGISKFFGDIFGKIKSVFKISDNSAIFKVFDGIKTFVIKFSKPFIEAFKVIKDLVTGPVSKIGSVFSNIGQYFGAFASKIGAVSKIVGKIFLPITIIMAVWDTVKGAFEGFKKDGIIGGVKGAITGLFGSLIGGLVDIVKDGISWILSMFGFDKAAKFLDSFSVTDIFKQFIDFLFKPVEMIRDMFVKMINWFKTLEIPGIGFSLLGKQFKMGPWKPFASDKKDAGKQPENLENDEEFFADSAKMSKEEARAIADSIDASAPQAANVVYAKSAENVGGGYKAPQSNNIVNAPTTITKQTSTSIFKTALRDEDASLRSYYKSRYAT
jgi:hypothetical protein